MVVQYSVQVQWWRRPRAPAPGRGQVYRLPVRAARLARHGHLVLRLHLDVEHRAEGEHLRLARGNKVMIKLRFTILSQYLPKPGYKQATGMDFLATSKQILINIDAQQESDLFSQLADISGFWSLQTILSLDLALFFAFIFERRWVEEIWYSFLLSLLSLSKLKMW